MHLFLSHFLSLLGGLAARTLQIPRTARKMLARRTGGKAIAQSVACSLPPFSSLIPTWTLAGPSRCSTAKLYFPRRRLHGDAHNTISSFIQYKDNTARQAVSLTDISPSSPFSAQFSTGAKLKEVDEDDSADVSDQASDISAPLAIDLKATLNLYRLEGLLTPTQLENPQNTLFNYMERQRERSRPVFQKDDSSYKDLWT